MKIIGNREINMERLFATTLIGFGIFLAGLILFVAVLTAGQPPIESTLTAWDEYVFIFGMYLIYVVSVFVLQLVGGNDKNVKAICYSTKKS